MSGRSADCLGKVPVWGSGEVRRFPRLRLRVKRAIGGFSCLTRSRRRGRVEPQNTYVVHHFFTRPIHWHSIHRTPPGIEAVGQRTFSFRMLPSTWSGGSAKRRSGADRDKSKAARPRALQRLNTAPPSYAANMAGKAASMGGLQRVDWGRKGLNLTHCDFRT